MSDVELARRVLSGDEAAFDEFFDRYFPRLYRFALARLGGNEDASEEIVQRVLIHALERLHTYRGEAALLTWLCALCRREIGAWHEREGRIPEVSFSDDRPEIAFEQERLRAAEKRHLLQDEEAQYEHHHRGEEGTVGDHRKA